MEIIDAKALLVGAKMRFKNNQEMIEALDMGIKALIKQMSKETIDITQVNKFGKCPSCRATISPFKIKFCSDCGQKLKWN